MKKILAIIVLLIAIISVIATDVDQDLGIVINPEEFVPRVFIDPNSRLVLDDFNEPGNISAGGEELIERQHDYAFQGEKILWDVLVWDKNSDDKIADVYIKLRMLSQPESYMQVNCYGITTSGLQNLTGLLYEGEEQITWNDDTMDWYSCELTVESPGSMQGEYLMTAEAIDVDGLKGMAFEEETWFMNPVIALGVTGNIAFGEVRPGSVIKSSTVTVGNAAESGSGVMMDMYIAGSDFYDQTSSGALCPTSNVLALTNFRYYASSGAYSTCSNAGSDAECYDNIPYFLTGAANPGNNNMKRIIDGSTPLTLGEYPPGNVLSPGSEMSMNFKLSLPEPCNGNSFSDGAIKIVGEAV